MRKIFSFFTALIIAVLSLNFNIVQAENLSPVTATAENGKYTWNFGVKTDGTASTAYDYSDEYADIRVSLGTGDSITSADGIKWSGASCSDTTSTKNSGRYILIKPKYSGKVKLTITFNGVSNNAKGRIWYCDFDSNEFDDVDTSLLKKLEPEQRTQLGDDITSSYANNLSFEVVAGHTYALYTYNKGSKITALSYESADIIGKTEKPTINTPIIASDTTVSGTCVDGANVEVTVNDNEPLTATVSGTEWTIDNLNLAADDTISVTAQVDDYKKSDAATAVVLAADDVSCVTIEKPTNGSVTADIDDLTKVQNGTKVTLTVTPDEGYKLSHLIIDGTEVEAVDNKYTFTVEKNVTVSAEFEEKVYYNITLPTAEHGTVTIAGGAENGKATCGDTVTLDVRCDDGYRIKTLKYTLNGKEVNLKYSKEFVMPENNVEITAEFAPLAVVSNVDTSLSLYDRLTLNVDGEPFFFNGIQIRADKVADNWGWTDEQIKTMFQQAADDGFTVVNTQIRWMDVQPDKAVTPMQGTETLHANGGDTSATAFVDFELPEGDIDYTAAKIRLNVTDISGTAVPRIYGLKASNDMTGAEDLGTTESWDVVNKAANYDIDVTDFVNANSGTLHFAIGADTDTSIGFTAQLVLSRDDAYDYTYLDKMISYAEDAGVKLEILWFALDTCQQSADSRVPYYILNNYQKTLASDGTPIRQRGTSYSFLMCKEDKNLRAKEQEVVETIFNHIADYNAQHGDKKTVVGCQITNEPSVARMHEGDYKYNDRCYCDTCQAKYDSFIENGKTKQDYLNDVMWNYQNSIAEAVKISDYSVWTRTNNYGGTDANIVEYNEQMRNTEEGTCIDFIGYDPYEDNTSTLYNFGHGTTKMTKVSVDYSQGKNLPMIMENGGGAKGSTKYQNANTLTLASLAGGSFYNVYELCGSDEYGMYLEKTYPLTQRGDYVEEVRKTNAMLNKIAFHLASKKADGANGTQLMFFNALSDNSETTKKMVRAIPVIYNTDNNGVGIAVEESKKEIVLESTTASEFVLKGIGEYTVLSVEAGYYNGTDWVKTGEKAYTEEDDDIVINTTDYDCIRVTVQNEIPTADNYSPNYIYNSEDNSYTYSFADFAEARSLESSASISNLKIYGAKGDYINPNSSVYKSSNGNETSEGGIWWNGKSSSGNRYMEYTPEKNGTLTLRLRNTYNAGNGSKSWLRYGTKGVENEYLGASEDLLSQEYTTMTLDLTKGTTYYFWPVGSGVNISSFVFTAEPVAFDDVLSYDGTSVTTQLDGDLIIARYDGDVLADVTVETVKAGSSKTVNVAGHYKVMLWNSLSGMTPIAKAIEFDITIQ